MGLFLAQCSEWLQTSTQASVWFINPVLTIDS